MDLFKTFITHNRIRSITINEQARVVCVVFQDGSKQLVRCAPGDQFDPEIGVSIAIARNLYDSRSRLLRRLIEVARYVEPRVKPEPVAMPESEPVVERTLKPKLCFLRQFLLDHGLKDEEAAEICDVSVSTIKRASAGYCVRPATFDKIVVGLELDIEQRTEFYKSLKRHQRIYL